MSEVVATEMYGFIEDAKTRLIPVEADVRDAKRRINSAKGGSRKRKAVQKEQEDDDDSEGSA